MTLTNKYIYQKGISNTGTFILHIFIIFHKIIVFKHSLS